MHAFHTFPLVVSIRNHSIPFPLYPDLLIWYLPTGLLDDDAAATTRKTSALAPKPAKALHLTRSARIGMCRSTGAFVSVAGGYSSKAGVALSVS